MTLAGTGDASQQALELRAAGVVVRGTREPRHRPGAPRRGVPRRLDAGGRTARRPAPRERLRRAMPRRPRARALDGADDRRDRHRREDDDRGVPRLPPAERRGRPSTRARRPARRTCGRPPSSCRRPTDGVVLMELTSSHLCFTTRSPTIAVITCFWPDHLELHGSLERYRAAKEAIVRRPGAGRRRRRERGRRRRGGDREPLPRPPLRVLGEPRGRRGRVRARRRMMLRDAAGERSFRLPPSLDAPRLQALLAAAATALAAGALPETAPRAGCRLRTARRCVGRLGDTELIDDGMAATPAKTASRPARVPRRLRRPRRRRRARERAASRSTRRARSGRCSRRPAPRRAASRASSSSSAPPRLASRRIFDRARRCARATLDEAIAPRLRPRRGREGARRLPDVPAAARGSRADRAGAPSAGRAGNSA